MGEAFALGTGQQIDSKSFAPSPISALRNGGRLGRGLTQTPHSTRTQTTTAPASMPREAQTAITADRAALMVHCALRVIGYSCTIVKGAP